jgi:hypothetical protein
MLPNFAGAFCAVRSEMPKNDNRINRKKDLIKRKFGLGLGLGLGLDLKITKEDNGGIPIPSFLIKKAIISRQKRGV